MLNSLFVEIASMPDFNEDTLSKAKEIYEEYKNKNVLIRHSFEDDTWTITDEYSITGLNFKFNEFKYRRFYENLFNISFDEFTNRIKCFVASVLGKYSPSAIRDFLNDIRRITTTNPDDIVEGKEDVSLFSLSMCIDFLYLISDENYDLVETIESTLTRNNGKQRTLADFDTYFLFGDIIDDFWKSDLDKATRLFYYPLYLWWHITGVIPLRPREFLVTERDCLLKKDDEYYIKLRRNQLKGRRVKGIKYKIDEDYKTQELKINNELAYEIERYLDWTNEFDRTDIDTLFIAEPHYAKWDRKKNNNSRFYTMNNLYTCLRYFYSEVIEDIYKLNVVSKDSHINKGEICNINLGDTRHLALINIMLEGGTPTTAMLLAGHENVEMASHYYSNITNIVECQIYRQYRNVIGGEVRYDFVPVSYAHKRSEGLVLSDGNLCFSKAYASGSISDCLKSAGPHGELAYCQKCRYYRNNGNSYYRDDKYKERIKKSCELLYESISLVRQHKGYTEDIGEALTNLKSNALTYAEYLKEKGVEDGQK